MLKFDAIDHLNIAVLIPCYNEELTVGKVVADFKAALPQAKVFVYDNNSTDHTRECAVASGAVLRLEPRQGKGNVVRRMFADVEADVYILVDGDDTYDARYAPRLINYLLNSQVDMLNVARQPIQQKTYRPGHEFGNRMLNFFVRLFFGNQFRDMLSGYRVFTRRFVKSFPMLTTGFEIETELTVHAIELQMPIVEVEIPFRKRPQGSASKLNTIRDGLKILRLIIRLMREDRPLQFFSSISLALLLFAVVLMWPVMLEYFKTGLVPKFPTLIVSTGLGLLSSLSFAVGLVLDTVTRGRRELKRLHYLALPVPWSQGNPALCIDNFFSDLNLSTSIKDPDSSPNTTFRSRPPARKFIIKQRFFQFALVGILGFVVDALGFAAFTYFTQSSIYLARAFAFFPAVTTTWYLNRNLTFGDRPKCKKKYYEYGAYLTANLTGMLVNFSIFILMISMVPRFKDFWIIPLSIGTLAGLLINYSLSNFRVFRKV